MAFFRRRSAFPGEPSASIEEFWSWWAAGGAAAADAAIRAGEPQRVVADLTRRVAAIHPDLAWELAPGATADHVLVVTSEGNPELRAPARRWLRAAPPACATWEFADARQPAADLAGTRLAVGDAELGFADVVVAPRRVGNRLDVALHHPLFGELPEPARAQICFLALDAALGETDVETWIGEITPATVPPLDAFGLSHLRGLVEQLAAEATDADGNPTWVLLQGEGPAGPLLATAQVPLAVTTAPELDRHVAVRVPFRGRNLDGLPDDASLSALRDLEDHLSARLEAGRLVAHETSAGVRVLHYYVESGTPACEVLRVAAAGWPQGRVEVVEEPDPGWHAVRHLRT